MHVMTLLLEVGLLQFSVEVFSCIEWSSEQTGLRVAATVLLSPLQQCGLLLLATQLSQQLGGGGTQPCPGVPGWREREREGGGGGGGGGGLTTTIQCNI